MYWKFSEAFLLPVSMALSSPKRIENKREGYGHLHAPGKTTAITAVALALWMPEFSGTGPGKAPADEFLTNKPYGSVHYLPSCLSAKENNACACQIDRCPEQISLFWALY